MAEKTPKMTCGIVMPISSIDGCSEAHWSDVLDILTEAIEGAGFEGNLVSNADDVGIIQKRIIQNLYENPVVVCDVSGKNPNVMFELGMRLAFDKPTIIIKDDRTTYSFDTSPIEHLEYPRDLRFSRIVDFKQKLAEKLKATHERASTDNNYTTFLKHFGEFTVAKLDKKEVSGQEFILEELRSLRMSMRRIERSQYPRDSYELDPSSKNIVDVCLRDTSAIETKSIMKEVSMHPGVVRVEIIEREPDHRHIRVTASDSESANAVEAFLQRISPKARVRNKRTQNREQKVT